MYARRLADPTYISPSDGALSSSSAFHTHATKSATCSLYHNTTKNSTANALLPSPPIIQKSSGRTSTPPRQIRRRSHSTTRFFLQPPKKGMHSLTATLLPPPPNQISVPSLPRIKSGPSVCRKALQSVSNPKRVPPSCYSTVLLLPSLPPPAHTSFINVVSSHSARTFLTLTRRCSRLHVPDAHPQAYP